MFLILSLLRTLKKNTLIWLFSSRIIKLFVFMLCCVSLIFFYTYTLFQDIKTLFIAFENLILPLNRSPEKLRFWHLHSFPRTAFNYNNSVEYQYVWRCICVLNRVCLRDIIYICSYSFTWRENRTYDTYLKMYTSRSI